MRSKSQLPSFSAPGTVGPEILILLAEPLCGPVLRAHLDGPLRFPDLRRRLKTPAKALRTEVVRLRDFGALDRRVLPRMPYTVENELSGLGHRILHVAVAVEAWLADAPGGPIGLDSSSATVAIKAFAEGWRSGVLHALATRPLALKELDRLIPSIAYPSLARRLSALRNAGLAEVLDGPGASAKCALTRWGWLALEAITDPRLFGTR